MSIKGVHAIKMNVFSESSGSDDKVTNENLNTFHVAGFFQQIKILSWKNYILSKRSIKGLVSECAIPILLLIILIIIREAVSIDYFKEINQPPKNVLSYFNDQNITFRNTILFYPNNSFVESIVRRSVEIIQINNTRFNPTSNV